MINIQHFPPYFPNDPLRFKGQVIQNYDNGYGLSAVIGWGINIHSQSTESSKLWALAVLHHGHFCENTIVGRMGIEDYLSKGSVRIRAEILCGLPKNDECTHKEEVLC